MSGGNMDMWVILIHDNWIYFTKGQGHINQTGEIVHLVTSTFMFDIYNMCVNYSNYVCENPHTHIAGTW